MKFMLPDDRWAGSAEAHRVRCPVALDDIVAQPTSSLEKAFGPATGTVSRVGNGMLFALAIVFLGYFASIVAILNIESNGASSTLMDFSAFWAAAKLGLAGDPASAFDPSTFFAALSHGSQVEFNQNFMWLYPPAFHIAIMPFGLMPFSVALAVFSLCSITAFVGAVTTWLPGARGIVGIVVASPAVWMALHAGNLTLVWCAVLLAVLVCLRQGKQTRAGILIAVLTTKPQLGLMLPFALLGASYWRAIVAATVASAGMVAATIAIFGVGYWVAFFDAITSAAELRAADSKHVTSMVSWYAFARIYGADQTLAVAIHFAGLFGVALLVAMLWRQVSLSFDLKTACLLIAIPLSTPYSWHYELVMPTAAIAFLIRDGFGRHWPGRVIIATLWLLPIPAWPLEEVWVAHYAPPVLVICFAACIWLALRGWQPVALAPVTPAPHG